MNGGEARCGDLQDLGGGSVGRGDCRMVWSKEDRVSVGKVSKETEDE